MAETMKLQGTSLLAVMTKRGLVTLPEEIMYDIFSRLQIKHLFLFRSVCKDWKRFITDPYFVDMHHARINQDDKHGSNFLIKCCSTSTSDEPVLYLVDNENHDSTSLKAFDINFKLPYSTKIMVVGSSNGLLCLCSLPDHGAYYICNPLTKEVWHLPRAYDLDKNLDTDHKKKMSPLGFAFDKTTNTYKVVFTWCLSEGIYGHGKQKTGVGIYTLGSGKWRRVEDVPARRFFNPQETSQVLVHGALHGILLCEPKSEFYNSIGAIDIRSENFRAFKMPPEHYGEKRTLGVLRESLCLIDDRRAGFVDVVVFWVMKEYGNKDSWGIEYIVKKNMLGPLQRVQSLKFFNTRKPKSVLLYGDQDDQGYYDLETKEFKHILSNEIQPSSNKVEAVVAHLGSLISPKRIDFPSAEMTCSKTPACTRPKRKLTSAQTSKTLERTRPKQKLRKSLRCSPSPAGCLMQSACVLG